MNRTANDECPQEEAAPVGSIPPDARPDWQGLRAGLGAAHAARRIVSGDGGSLLRHGSFDCMSAHALTSFMHALTDINVGTSEVVNLLGGNYRAATGSPYRQWLR